MSPAHDDCIIALVKDHRDHITDFPPGVRITAKPDPTCPICMFCPDHWADRAIDKITYYDSYIYSRSVPLKYIVDDALYRFNIHINEKDILIHRRHFVVALNTMLNPDSTSRPPLVDIECGLLTIAGCPYCKIGRHNTGGLLNEHPCPWEQERYDELDRAFRADFLVETTTDKILLHQVILCSIQLDRAAMWESLGENTGLEQNKRRAELLKMLESLRLTRRQREDKADTVTNFTEVLKLQMKAIKAADDGNRI